MRTRPRVFLIPMLRVACKDGAETSGVGTGSGTEPADTSAGSVTEPTTGGTNPGTGTGSATGNGTTSGDPTGNPTGDPTGDPPTTTETTATSTGADTSTDCADAPRFESDIIPILEASCGSGAIACHSREAYGATADRDCRGWVTFENAPLGAEFYSGPNEGNPTGCPDLDLYDRLINLDSWQCEAYEPKMRYVAPCKPEESYVVRKIDGGPYCSEKVNDMPVMSQPMPMGMVLDPKSVKTIKDWIAFGAPRIGDDPCAACGDDPDPGPQDPVAQINHPGDGEVRKVNVDIPFVGFADDPQDGKVPADKLIWTSDLEGQIGVGENFNAPLSMVGKHTITLTATDIDGNEGTASLVLNME